MNNNNNKWVVLEIVNVLIEIEWNRRYLFPSHCLSIDRMLAYSSSCFHFHSWQRIAKMKLKRFISLFTTIFFFCTIFFHLSESFLRKINKQKITTSLHTTQTFQCTGSFENEWKKNRVL